MTRLAESQLGQGLREGAGGVLEGMGGAYQFVNVGPKERISDAALGLGALLVGLSSRSSVGKLLGLVGGAALMARGTSGYCPLYQALGVNNARQGRATAEDFHAKAIHVDVSMTIGKPAEELFRFWRSFENLPRFMEHLERVDVKSEKDSHWVAKAPAGMSVEWDATIINEEPNRLIAWRSLEGASVDNAGSVRFVEGPQGRGTEVRVTIDYIPPAGRIGYVVAKLFGEEPTIQVREDLRRFKRLMEAGEIPTVEGQPQGRCAMFS